MSGSTGKLGRLASELIAATQQGRVSWQPTDLEDSFLCSLPGGTGAVTITRNSSHSMLEYFRMDVLNPSGTVIDTASSGVDLFTTGDLPNPLLSELHDLARRDALNVDSLLDSMLDELGGGGGS
jgi:hypothetical protein